MILLLFTIIRITLKIKYGRKALADKEEKVIFGGRLGECKKNLSVYEEKIFLIDLLPKN